MAYAAAQPRFMNHFLSTSAVIRSRSSCYPYFWIQCPLLYRKCGICRIESMPCRAARPDARGDDLLSMTNFLAFVQPSMVFVTH